MLESDTSVHASSNKKDRQCGISSLYVSTIYTYNTEERILNNTLHFLYGVFKIHLVFWNITPFTNGMMDVASILRMGNSVKMQKAIFHIKSPMLSYPGVSPHGIYGKHQLSKLASPPLMFSWRQKLESSLKSLLIHIHSMLWL